MNPIRLRGPADVLAALPYQLGYHPEDCLVVISLQGQTVGLVERLDLPSAEHTGAAASALAVPLLREDPDAVLLVGYETRAGASRPLMDALDRELQATAVTVLDRLVVRDGRWFAPDCDSGCCPEDGAALPDPAHTPAVADFVGLEMSPLADRRAVGGLVVADGALSGAVAEAIAQNARGPLVRDATPAGPSRESGDDHVLAVTRLRLLSLWGVAVDVSADARAIDTLTADEVADLESSLHDIELRDGLVAWLCPGTMPLEILPPDLLDQLRSCLPPPPWGLRPGDRSSTVAGRRLLARLQWLVRAVPDSHAAPILTVLANVGWWLGDGALARVALERALEHTPDYRLARLLERMVDLGVRPVGPGRRAVPA